MIKGVVRQLDHLGRIVIPKEMRDSLKMETGDPVDIFIRNDVICIEKCKVQCTICGSTKEDKLLEVEGVHICNNCISKMAALSKKG
jgi:transcriptional pleiotropic regulator of transition state genes